MQPLFFYMLIISCIFSLNVTAQHLQPGFDKQEYLEAMLISVRSAASPSYSAKFPEPQHYTMAYQSPAISFDNMWDLWIHENHTMATLSIRGTTSKSVSWLANFYAAMVPAKGELQLTDSTTFPYQLAENPKAAVHVGWLVAMAFLSKDMLPKIDSCYKAGIKDMMIVGHSQGGGIAYLLTAYFNNLQKQDIIPKDIQFKTYCSAAPKPGNLYFAYEYEKQTQDGWAYNVVNAADWVPEVPISIQTVNDFNNTNPFKNAKEGIKQQKFPNKIVLKHVYNKLDRPTRRAQKNYQKFLGKMTSKLVKSNLPGFVPPEYYKSNNYVRTGDMVVLYGEKDYYEKFPDSDTALFVHHFHQPYLYLAEKLPDFLPTSLQASNESNELDGTWELDYISGSRIAFEGLYPEKKPTILFNTKEQKVNGNTSCNNFNGELQLQGNKINFAKEMAMTRMMCQGEGEQAFINTLKKVNSYSISNSGNTLNFIMGDIAIMRFQRK